MKLGPWVHIGERQGQKPLSQPDFIIKLLILPDDLLIYYTWCPFHKGGGAIYRQPVPGNLQEEQAFTFQYSHFVLGDHETLFESNNI